MKRRLALLIICALIAGCKSAELSSTAIEDNIIYTLTMPGNSFTVKDTLVGSFEVWNFSGRNRRFDFPSQQQFAFLLLRDLRDTVLRYPDIVQPAWSDFSLPGGGKKTFPFKYSLTSWYRSVPPGKYTLRAYLWNASESPKVDLQIEVK